MLSFRVSIYILLHTSRQRCGPGAFQFCIQISVGGNQRATPHMHYRLESEDEQEAGVNEGRVDVNRPFCSISVPTGRV
jgi:hypothetical protein